MSDLGILVLRLGMGGFMASHGFDKLMRFFADKPIEFVDYFGIGEPATLAMVVFAEFFCAICIVVGLKARWVAIPLIITMLVAAFVAHGDDPFAKKEKALLYLVGYTAIALLGSGKYSIDGILKK